jgi:pimeloyl-ACP methyl ester carboxylesterase
MRVQVGDVKLYFDVEGAKLRPDGARMREVPTVLLLHGGPGFDHSSFKPEFAPLAEAAQLIYLDHRGQGRSERGAPERWTLAQWGDDVRAFCDALGIERPIVLGQSFGGMVAMSYASRHPDHPARLVLSSTAARIRVDRALAMFERLGGAEARDIARTFFDHPDKTTVRPYRKVCLPLYTRTRQSEDWIKRTEMNEPLTLEFFKGEARTFNLLPELAKIRCTTLITVGEDDPITPAADAEDIAAAMAPGIAQLRKFSGAGHGVYRDLPGEYFAALREFIAAA